MSDSRALVIRYHAEGCFCIFLLKAVFVFSYSIMRLGLVLDYNSERGLIEIFTARDIFSFHLYRLVLSYMKKKNNVTLCIENMLQTTTFSLR